MSHGWSTSLDKLAIVMKGSERKAKNCQNISDFWACNHVNQSAVLQLDTGVATHVPELGDLGVSLLSIA